MLKRLMIASNMVFFSSSPCSNFILYLESGNITTKIKAIYQSKNFHQTLSKNENQLGLVLEKTNFYAEQGGQEYDVGTITTVDGDHEFIVEDVQLYGGYVLHVGYLKSGSISVDDEVVCTYDEVSKRGFFIFL